MGIKVQLRQRPARSDSHLPSSLHPLLRRLYALRGIENAQELTRSVKGMLPWQELSGINTAVHILEQVLAEYGTTIVVGDFDVDGATSTALIVLALRRMGGNVDYLMPSRSENGYGLSPEIVEQVAARGAKLILTVDNGIAAHSAVDVAHANAIQVIITDHHLPGHTLPEAEAIVNPNLPGCTFPSKALAGVGVAFYLMLALRSKLYDSGWFTHCKLEKPNLAELLDLVALGTVSDMVPLDTNNRILVYQGLQRIRSEHCRPGIRALLEVAHHDSQKLVASDLGFVLGPRINASGRLNDMSSGVALLLTEDMIQARILARDLDMMNNTRREIEQGMQKEALHMCENIEFGTNELPYGLAIYHSKWHQGIVGILASRMKERFHRPVIAFALAKDGILKGSGRSVPGFHMRNALEQLNVLNPGLIITFGGHAMAAGLLLKEAKFFEFRQRFSELAGECLNPEALEQIIWSDGELSARDLSLATAELVRNSGPWGQNFPEPIFHGTFQILKQRLLKKKHLKLNIKRLVGGQILDAIAFNVDTALWPNSNVRQVELAYKLDVNTFRGNRNIQLLIQHLWPH